MKCISKGCPNQALPHSNYCLAHRPRPKGDGKFLRKKVAKKSARRKFR
jgi:hypothetical protein